MSEADKNSKESRNTIAFLVLAASFVIVGLLAALTIIFSKDDLCNVFNLMLPVIATWVGTVIAFYFGKENFESANKEAREILKVKEEKTKKPVEVIMKRIFDITSFDLEGRKEEDIQLDKLIEKYTESANRLPVLNADSSPKYMIHRSSINDFLLEKKGKEDTEDKKDDQNDDKNGKKKSYTLKEFIDFCKSKDKEFVIGKSFVIVSENTTIEDAKRKMEAAGSFCQDIFITKNGGENEPLTGWISNLRLSRYLTG